ncbi:MULTISPECIES: hypothetical protein [unclassified Sporosarcina]|uniref:hypothetical protein n=1 Tax=unclassified Sporosarcina TaxID=2647733 RepID=UPI000C165E54|nr:MULTISPECIES: hypothetical protein [unclassified Sporosarcina]PIC99428.1 hypothetical protein CSV68_08435 [Sporosarcina sp. P29]PID06255.1 hypothetical protein CSV66_05265 [Sporosarcina sp. P30]PID09449.1 hypothetical protein CSV65_05265 [Sporosarcina sp. P31]PID12747.1 hypothetical protein CSV64_04730 [Sporosarcina sp. P32b]
MQGEKKQLVFIMLAFICAAGVFFLSGLFQSMAYWGNGLTWYWIGVVLTFITGMVGTAFILQSLKVDAPVEKNWLTILLISLRALAVLAIGLGFLWTTFVVVAGMSGM